MQFEKPLAQMRDDPGSGTPAMTAAAGRIFPGPGGRRYLSEARDLSPQHNGPARIRARPSWKLATE